MTILAKEIAQSMGACGLICKLCADRNNGCKGCGSGITASCRILNCCNRKSVQGCFECSQYPCGCFPPGERKFDNVRVLAINHVAREDGLDKLADYLARNHESGIIYHRTNSSCGDYDLDDIAKVIDLIRLGRPKVNESLLKANDA